MVSMGFATSRILLKHVPITFSFVPKRMEKERKKVWKKKACRVRFRLVRVRKLE